LEVALQRIESQRRKMKKERRAPTPTAVRL
jgi:hypothetical protein